MKDVNTTVIDELTPEQIAASRARRKAEVALYKDSVIDMDKVRLRARGAASEGGRDGGKERADVL